MQHAPHGPLRFTHEEKQRQGDQQQYPAQGMDLTKGNDIRLGDHLSIDDCDRLSLRGLGIDSSTL